MSAEEVGKAFVQHWYQVRGSDPNQLAGLFQPQSMLTFEGAQLQGPQAIVEKLNQIGRAQYKAGSTDIQPSLDANSMMIFVTGTVLIGDGGNPVLFSETFQLSQSAPGQYYVHNCMFRLIYGL